MSQKVNRQFPEDLQERMEIGEFDRRNEYIEKNLPLVYSIARKKLKDGVEMEDLVQEGILGMVTAIEKFEPEKGFQFSTYASWWIKQRMEDYILKFGDSVRKPTNYQSNLKSILKATDELTKKNGREPSFQEIVKKSKLDEKVARRILCLIPGTLSIDSSADDGGENGPKMKVLEDRNSETPFEHCVKDMISKDIFKLLDILSEREREVVTMRFGLKDGRRKSLRSIGKTYGLSAERIRQIEQRALKKLRTEGNTADLKEYYMA